MATMKNKVDIGISLKNLRINAGLSQKEVAKAIGVSTSTISAYESGANYPLFENFCKLVDLYETSADLILGKNPFTVNIQNIDTEQRIFINNIVEKYVHLLNSK